MDQIELLRKLTQENPDSATSWHLLGREQVARGELDAALQSFSRALQCGDGEMRAAVLEELAKAAGAGIPRPSSPSSVQPESEDETESEDEPESEDVPESEDEPESEGVPASRLRVLQGGGDRVKVFPSPESAAINFDDVGGLDDLKQIIRMKIIKPFLNPGLFSRFRKRAGGGILLYGPPGCGKTYVARATAGECRATFMPVKITDILDPYFGVSARNVGDIFASARASHPCVLFFDEIDTLGFNRSKMSSEHMRPVVDQMLSEIDGIDPASSHLLIMAATNMPWDVDAALKRPGRFDKLIFVMPPDRAAREAILRLKMQGRPVSAVDVRQLAERTELFSGADLENLVELAAEQALSEIMETGNERDIGMTDFLNALDQVRPTTTEWLRTIRNYVKYANQDGTYADVSAYLEKVRFK